MGDVGGLSRETAQTELPRSEDPQKNDEERVNEIGTLVDSANVPIIGTDMKGNVAIWNQHAVLMSGFAKVDVIGKNLVKHFITENFKQSVAQVLSEACQGRNTANFSFPFIAKDGESFSMLLNAGARYDTAGNIIGVIAVGHNLTQYNVTRGIDVSKSEELAGIIDSANAPILGVNTEGVITIWNEKAVLLTGYTKQDTFGKVLVHDFIIDSYKEKVQSVLTKAIEGISTSNYEVPLVTKDGRHIDLVLNAAPRRDLYGGIAGVVCIGQDVTFLRRVTKEFSLYLWHIDDMEAPLRSMSPDAQKSVTSVAEWTSGHDVGEEQMNKTCDWLRSFLKNHDDVDAIEMFERDAKTIWCRIVGQKSHDGGCKGYLLDVTHEHAAQLKSKQAEHYLRIISRATFDFVLHVDSKSLVVSAEWGGSEDSDRPKDGDNLREWLLVDDDMKYRTMLSSAMLMGSSTQSVMFRRGASTVPAECLCVIDPDDPGLMIIAVKIKVAQTPAAQAAESVQKMTAKSLQKAHLERRDVVHSTSGRPTCTSRSNRSLKPRSLDSTGLDSVPEDTPSLAPLVGGFAGQRSEAWTESGGSSAMLDLAYLTETSLNEERNKCLSSLPSLDSTPPSVVETPFGPRLQKPWPSHHSVDRGLGPKPQQEAPEGAPTQSPHNPRNTPQSIR